jgi:septum formation inhibitor-activating ATPase MinD
MSLKKNQWRVNCGIVYKDAGEIPFCRIFVHELLTSIAITLKLEYAIVEDFVQRIGTEIIGVVPRDSDIQRAEEQNMTVVQMDSELPVSQTIIDIAKRIMVPVEEQKEGAV